MNFFSLPTALLATVFAGGLAFGLTQPTPPEPGARALVRPAAPAAKPNIIVLLLDDVGYSDLGCYGGEIKTPNLDALAAGGLRLTHMYNSARCCPTRASLLTGLQPHQVGVGHMVSGALEKSSYEGYNGFRADNNLTLAEALKQGGYFTAMAGKWHLKPGTPVSRGFAEYYGMLGGFGSCWEPKLYVRLPQGRPVRSYPEGGFYATDAITDYAQDFTDQAQREQKPFFLYLAYNAPHFPLHAPKAETDKYYAYYQRGWDRVRTERYARMRQLGVLGPDVPELSPRGVVPVSKEEAATHPLPAWDALPKDQQLDLARRMAIYAGMLDRLDQNVGRLLAHLKAQGQLDNTLIMVLSDNGACAEWGEYGFDGKSSLTHKVHTGPELDQMGLPGTYHSYGTGWANVGNTPFTLYKHFAHEGGIASPLIVSWPAGLKRKNQLDHRPSHITDVMATCLDVAGLDYAKLKADHPLLPLEGVSLTPALRGDKAAPRTICVEHEGNRMVRQGDWKLVSAHYRDNRWELYNLRTDRSEQHDLAARYPDRVRDLAAQYAAWATPRHVLPWDQISPFPKPGAAKGPAAADD